VTGSIDEKVRHAITKLSDIHLVSTKRSKEYVIKMGEDKKNVFLTGCPSIDIARKSRSKLPKDFFDTNGGVGNLPRYGEKYIVVVQHPVTTKFNNTDIQIRQTIDAILKIKNIKIVWLWPNIDAGSDIISNQLRIVREKKIISNISFFKNFSPENYIKLICNSECLVGNSSSGIRESAFLSIPVVNIGARQKNRERGNNVLDVDYDKDEIYEAINKQIKVKKIKKSLLYGNGFASQKIIKVLNKIFKKKINIEKELNYIKAN
jgi:UDP-N-acetylglucosamine 2-epimerase/N-acetylmannosamine kinase